MRKAAISADAQGVDVKISRSTFIVNDERAITGVCPVMPHIWFDVNYGRLTDGYSSREEAVADVRAFVSAIGITSPDIVDCGDALQVFITRCGTGEVLNMLRGENIWGEEAWRADAKALIHEVKAWGLAADISVTTDLFAAGRLPGTHNRRDPKNPLPVRLLQGWQYARSDFASRLWPHNRSSRPTLRVVN